MKNSIPYGSMYWRRGFVEHVAHIVAIKNRKTNRIKNKLARKARKINRRSL